jgi:hypothetical protein
MLKALLPMDVVIPVCRVAGESAKLDFEGRVRGTLVCG